MRSGGEGARKEKKKKLANPSRGLPRLVSKFLRTGAWEQMSEQTIKETNKCAQWSAPAN